MTEHQKKMEREAAKRKEFAAQPKARHLWRWRGLKRAV
jgi:muconolactone delta-isomerase